MGPETFRLDELIRKGLNARKDAREVIADANGRYYGAELHERSLLPGTTVRIGATRFEDRLEKSAVR